MLEIEFERFHDQDYVEEGFELYVMKNGSGDVLYVGISSQSVWERWFGWNGHMLWDGKIMHGNSPVGEKIADHLPDSLTWKIQLWTLNDCITFCSEVLPENKSNLTIKFVEPFMIQKLSPILNITYNLIPSNDTTPKSEREKNREEMSNKLYDKIFNKR